MKQDPTVFPPKTGFVAVSPSECEETEFSGVGPQTGAPLFDVRTDLAVEENEEQEQSGQTSLTGVTVDEYNDAADEEDPAVHVTRVVIRNEASAQALKKPIGTYITMDSLAMCVNDGDYHRGTARVLAKQLRELIKPFLSSPSAHSNTSTHVPTVLAVGLGNPNVTPDALGPRVLDNLLITRHLKTGQFQLPSFSADQVSVCGIAPGVMAQTGMETAEIIQALAARLRPDLIIAIDALAARSVLRLGTTIQLSDTGIHPGSGVGNHRHGLTLESLGVPVIAIGVPTVVSAAAIVTDTLDALIQVLRREMDTENFAETLAAMSDDEKYALIRELLEPRFGSMFVTPKDIDETLNRLSYTISEGINMALFKEQ